MADSKRRQNGVGMIEDLPPVVLHEGRVSEQQIAQLYGKVRQLVSVLNGQIRFGNGVQSTQSGNIDGQWKEYIFTLADTPYEIPHGLGRIPVGILTLDVNVSGAVLKGELRGDWNASRIFLSSSEAATTGLFVIV